MTSQSTLNALIKNEKVGDVCVGSTLKKSKTLVCARITNTRTQRIHYATVAMGQSNKFKSHYFTPHKPRSAWKVMRAPVYFESFAAAACVLSLCCCDICAHASHLDGKLARIVYAGRGGQINLSACICDKATRWQIKKRCRISAACVEAAAAKIKSCAVNSLPSAHFIFTARAFREKCESSLWLIKIARE